MKAHTMYTARIITAVVGYLIFFVASSCVIDQNTASCAVSQQIKCIEKSTAPAENINTTGLISVSGTHLL